MRIVQIPCCAPRKPDWAESAWALRQVLSAHGCCSKARLLQWTAAALDTEVTAGLEKTLKQLLRTTDIGGSGHSSTLAAAPPRILSIAADLPELRLGDFPGCGQRQLTRLHSTDSQSQARRLSLLEWEGPSEGVGRDWLQARVQQLHQSKPRDPLNLKLEAYRVGKSGWGRDPEEGSKWLLLRSSLGQRWRFFWATPSSPEPTQWIEIDADTASRLRFALHLAAKQPLPGYYRPEDEGLLLKIPFLPRQEFCTLSLFTLEPIEFDKTFRVHPRFGQFALTYLADRLGLGFQEAKL